MTTTLEKLPALDQERLVAQERAKIDKKIAHLDEPDKALHVLAKIAVDAEKTADKARERRDELMVWLRWEGDRQGRRNLGIPGAMGVFYTRPSAIVKEVSARLGYDMASDAPPPVYLGDDPVGEFRRVSEKAFRADARKKHAVLLRNQRIVALHNAGVSRHGIHHLAGRVFDESLISQVVAAHERGSGGQ